MPLNQTDYQVMLEKPQAQSGFTLTELMVTVAIVGILAGLAAPSFRDMLNQNNATSLANELATTLNLARSEAIKRAVRVTVCKSADIATSSSPSCSTTANWQAGWLIFTDKSTSGTFDSATDTRLKVAQPSSSRAVITATSTFANYISYLPSGLSKGEIDASPDGSFDICVDGAQRSIKVSATGRVRIRMDDGCS